MAVEPNKPFADFAAEQLGEGTRRGGYTFHLCPAHDDHDPSFGVKKGASSGRCYACGFSADAIALVQHLNPGMTFPEARAIVTGEADAPRPARRATRPPRPKADETPAGWRDFALSLVEEAERALWSDAGADARAYLAGRCLTEGTIRAARLGLIPEDRRVGGTFPDGKARVPAGVLIPWFEVRSVAMINVRRPDGSDPKYWAIRGSRRGRPYTRRSPIVAGRPLVIVEGEFEALLLNQELAGLVGAVTFGSASDRPRGRGLDLLAPASPWLVAVDGDAAGIRSADEWLAASDRCYAAGSARLPGSFKDWTEARQAGVDLRRWWSDRLAGVDSPELFTWGELAARRWGPSLHHDLPGLDAGRDRPLRPL